MKAKKIASLLLAVLMLVSMLALPVSATEAVAAAEVVEVGTETELRDAIAAGKSVKLTADIALNSKLSVTASNITIDGDGYNITASDSFTADITGQNNLVKLIGADEVSGVTGVKLMNIKLVTTAAAKHALDIWCSKGIVLENVTLDHENAEKGAPLVINGSDVTVQGTFNVIVGEKSWYGVNVDDKNGDACLNFATGAVVNFDNSVATDKVFMQADIHSKDHNAYDMFSGKELFVTYAGDKAYYGLNDYCDFTAAIVSTSDGEGGVVEYGEATLEEAVANACPGDTITLLKDVTLTDDIDITDGMDITVEGAGKTITAADDYDVFYVTGGKLTLGEGLNLVVPKYCGIYIRGGDVITSANITKYGTNYSAIQGNGQYAGNVTINGGTIINEVEYPAGDVCTNNVAIYWPQSGKLTINDGTIIGDSAVRMVSGSLEINGGTLKAVGAKAPYITANGGNFDETGDALTVDNANYPGKSPVVVINDGTFISEKAEAVGSYALTGHPVVTGFIKGGTFSSNVKALVAENYECVQSGNMYVVGEHKPVTVPAKAPTCTAEGNLEYTYCETCKVYVVKDMGAATVAPILPKLDHVPEAARVGVVPATHEAAGYTGDVVCACGELLIEGDVIPKLEAEVAVPKVDEEAHETVTDEVQNVVAAINGGANPDEVKTVVTEETKAAVEEAYAAGAAAGKEVVIGADIVAQPIQEEEIEKEEVEAIEEKAAALAKDDEEVVIASYLDISVLVVNRSDDNKVLGKITELEKPVEIQIVVPESLRVEGAKYVVVHYHDGKAEIIEGKYKDGVLTIKTDKFSTYALAVVTMPTTGESGATEDEKEEEKEEEPTASPSPSTEPTATPAPTTAPTATPAPTAAPTATAAPTKAPSNVPATGDESNVFALCAIMAMSAAAAYIVLKKFRKA